LAKTRGALLLVVLLLVVMLGLAGNAVIMGRLSLATVNYGLPTNPGYNPGAGQTIVHYLVRDRSDKYTQGGTGQAQTLNINGCSETPSYGFCSLYGIPSGTLYIPLGMEDSQFLACYGFGGACTGAELLWNVKTPAVSVGCDPGFDPISSCTDARGFDFTGTVIGNYGGYLLTSAAPSGDPTCTNYSGKTGDSSNQNPTSCWTADYSIIQAAQSANPTSCPPGSTGYTCAFTITSRQALSGTDALAYLTTPQPSGPGYNSTYAQSLIDYCVAHATYTGCPITKTTSEKWYLYRTITSLQFQLNAPQVQVQCVVVAGSCTDTQCLLCDGPAVTNQLRGYIQNHVLPELNQIGVLTSTQISFALSVNQFVPAFSGDCVTGIANSCWWGIAGAWIGGQGIQTAGCSGTYCGPSNIVQQEHAQLALYQDPGLTTPAPVSAGVILDISHTTNQTVAQVTESSVYPTIYTAINTANLGVHYTYSGDANCDANHSNNCINSPAPFVINLPLIYDVLGSETSYFYQYPAIPPSGGSNSGSITGTVVDSSNKNLFTGQFAPIAGACIGVGGPCSGYAGQIQSQTDQNGKYTLSNLAAGTYAIYANAGGYYPVIITGVQVNIGAVTQVPISMSPTVPPGQLCLIPPIPNPVPYQPPLFGGFCLPTWIVVSVFAISGLGLAAIIVASPLGRAGGRIVGSFSRRR